VKKATILSEGIALYEPRNGYLQRQEVSRRSRGDRALAR
jgi:hypothetical protein